MNSETAGILMRCHREGREPGARVQKAVRVAEGDPELLKSLNAQLAFDAPIVEAIHSIVPPEDLRDKLAALNEAAGLAKPTLRSHMVNPAIMAAVAGLLLIIGVSVFLVLEGMEQFPGRETAEQILSNTIKSGGAGFEPITTTTTQLGDWFMLRGYDGYEVPPGMAGLPVVGSQVARLEGKPIAQFVVDWNDSVVHEFRATDFGIQLPPDGDWKIFEQDRWVAAIRQRGERCFMVSFRGEKREMREYLRMLRKE
jgi:hypothetical protein